MEGWRGVLEGVVGVLMVTALTLRRPTVAPRPSAPGGSVRERRPTDEENVAGLSGAGALGRIDGSAAPFGYGIVSTNRPARPNQLKRRTNRIV